MSRVNHPKLKYIIISEEENKDKLEEIKLIIAQSLVDYYKQSTTKTSD